MIINISWKNIWRNKSRSLIIMTAMTLGIFAGMFLTSFMKGMGKQRVESALKTEVSHIQINQPGFHDNVDLSLFIENTKEIENTLDTMSSIEAYSKHVIVQSMIKTSKSSVASMIIGVDPEREVLVTDLQDQIIEGTYLNADKRNKIVISKKLAKKLDVGLKKKIIISLVNLNGDIDGDAFKVVGIYETSNAMYDDMHVFVRNEDLARIAGMDSDKAHMYSINLKEGADMAMASDSLMHKLPLNEVEDWKKANPILSYTNDAMDQYMIVLMAIIMLALFFGIVNTMLMAILERTRELGMLMAIGMNKKRVFLMIMLETVMLSLSGAVGGIILGSVVNGYFSRYGLDLSVWGEGLESIGYDPIIYFVSDFNSIVIIVVNVMVTGIFAAIYPAIKALKLRPSEAIRAI